ncbi:MAG: YncE family protein, partial [Flavisolibacter sp.]|nr:YncE family protein [Flavisolibacter sp.]
KGRIDHMDVNLKARIIYMAALGNNTLEVIDIANGKLLHSISGLDEPQGVGYIPQHNEIIVANGGNGDCYFYSAATFEKVATVHLASDADDVRVDSAAKKIYVGYGKGGIAVIDADTHQQVGDVQLPAHPEGFQIDKALNQLYVNLPDAGIVGVIDLKEMKLTAKWPNNNLAANFPMAIDTVQHHVFIGYRKPARLVVMNARNNQFISSLDIVGDTDDLYYDNRSHTVYISGGEGAINLFRENGSTYKQIANVPTRSGARTSLLIPQLKLFAVAARPAQGQPAALLVYHLQP